MLTLAAPAFADTLPPPTASYDASVTADIGDNHTTALVNAAGPKLRATVTLPAGPLTVLIDRAADQATILVPSLGAAVPVTPKMMGGYDLNTLNTIELTPEGPDTVYGVAATRYAVDTEFKPGNRFSGHVWATSDGAILSIDGTAFHGADGTPVRIILSNFQRRPQNPALFVRPADGRQQPLDCRHA